MATAATANRGRELDSATARSRYAPAMPSMALPSTEKAPPACARESPSPAAIKDRATVSGARGAAEGRSSASTRRSSTSRRAFSWSSASGSSPMSVTRGKEFLPRSIAEPESMYPETTAFKSMRPSGSSDPEQNSTGYTYSGSALVSGGRRVRALFRPRRQKLYQYPQKNQRQQGQRNRHQQALARHQAHLVGGVAEKALGKQLPADHHVPAHGKNADQGQRSGDYIEALADDFIELHHLRQEQQNQRRQRSKADLDQNMRNEELRMHHEIQAAEGFVGLVAAVNQVQHLQAEVDDEDIEQIHRDGVHAADIDGQLAQFSDGHVEQHDTGNPRHHGRKDEDHRHQRRGPPWVGLDGAEDETDVSVQQKGGGNADQRHDPADAVVEGQRARADVAGAERHHPVDLVQQALAGLRQKHDLAAVVEPDLQHQHSHQIPQVHVTEHGHGRGAVRGKVHLR